MVSLSEKVLKIERLVEDTKKDCMVLQRDDDLTDQGRGQLTFALLVEKVLNE